MTRYLPTNKKTTKAAYYCAAPVYNIEFNELSQSNRQRVMDAYAGLILEHGIAMPDGPHKRMVQRHARNIERYIVGLTLFNYRHHEGGC